MRKLSGMLSALLIVIFIFSLSAGLRVSAQEPEENPAGAVVSTGEAPPVPASGEVAPGGGVETSPDDIIQPLVEGFEDGTLGQFSSQVPICDPGGCGWDVSSDAHSGGYSAMAPDVPNISDQRLLLTTAVAIPGSATGAELTFWHAYGLEYSYDGGVLEISIDGGTSWNDAGANIISGGYNLTISSCCGNPLSGRQAWSGGIYPSAFSEVKVDLLPYAGNSVLFRFRLGTDNSVSSAGWWIDDITITIASTRPCSSPTWTEMAPYPLPVLDEAAVVLGGQLYSFGGVSNSAVISNAYRYSPASNTWTAVAALPEGRAALSAVTDGTFIYLLGGYSPSGIPTNSLYAYNPQTNSYTSLAPYTTPTFGQAAAYVDGKIYRIGGCAGNCDPVTSTVEAYAIGSNTWAPVADLPAAEGWLMAAADGGYVYAAGGITGSTSSQVTYRYDPSVNAWDDGAIAYLPSVLWGAASGFVDGKWLIAGGYLNNAITNVVYAWDPAVNAWLTTTPMLFEFARLSGAAIGPAFYAVGGRSPSDYFNGSTENQRYLDIPCVPCQATNWAYAQPYPQRIARYGFGQVGDDFYIFSGVTDGAVVGNVRRYNAVSDTWTDLSSILMPGEAPSAAYWNGKFYVTQGYSGPGFQIYDVATDSWSSAASIPVANTYGTALGAYNGYVFLVGSGYPQTPNTYVYTIASNSWAASAPAPSPYMLGGYTQVGQYLYLVGSFGDSPLDGNTGLPMSSVLSVAPDQAAPEANTTVTMRLDLATGVWSLGPVWTPGRADFGLASDGVKLYAIGGDATGGSYFDPTSVVNEYLLADWPAGSWITSPPNLPAPTQGNQAGFFNNGAAGAQIWSTGGVVNFVFSADNIYRNLYGDCTTQLCPGPTQFSGSLAPGDLVASSRLFRDGAADSCAVPGTCSIYGTGSYFYDQYPFVNLTGVDQCLTITANTACTGTDFIYVASYQHSFDPNNICTNWLADIGSSPNPTGSYSNIVAPGQSIVIVVETVSSGATCSAYTLDISADRCSAIAKVFLPFVERP